MDIGILREVITIRRRPVTTDVIGGQVEGSPTIVVADLPAAVEPFAASSEQILAGQFRAAVTKRVRIRWRDDVTVAMEVVWRARVLEIGAIEEPTRLEELHLLCAEVHP